MRIMAAILERAIKKAGGMSAFARALKLSRAAIYRWDKIPAERVVAIERATGIPREELRPDLYAGKRA